MSRMPNYYETLNVSNTSSFAELQASYNILKKMFGADPQMTTELDEALMVLGNADSRKAYDRMMTEAMNRKAARSVLPAELPPIPVENPVAKAVNLDDVIAFDLNQRSSLREMNGGLASKLVAIACSVAIIGLVFVGITSNKEVLSRVGFLGLDELFPSATFDRPVSAPNGQPFPETTGYISGYEQRNTWGESSITVINSKNDNDVYLKLVALEGGSSVIARHVLIKGKSDFTIDKLAPGKYEIQYLDLVAGKGGRSEIFMVTEHKTDKGIEASRLSVKLKTAINGVLRVEQVTVEEFNKLASL